MRPEDNVDYTDRDLSFLAPPGAVMDWRLLLLQDAADAAGLLEALPGRPPELAARLGLDPQAVGVVLAALALYGVVEADGDGGFSPGPEAPGPEATAVLSHHARALRHRAAGLSGRLGGADAGERPPPVGRWLDGLAVYAREGPPEAVDACLAHAPRRRRRDARPGRRPRRVQPGVRPPGLGRHDAGPAGDDRPRARPGSGGGRRGAAVRWRSVRDIARRPLRPGVCAGVTNGLGPEANVALAQRVRSCLAPVGTWSS